MADIDHLPEGPSDIRQATISRAKNCALSRYKIAFEDVSEPSFCDYDGAMWEIVATSKNGTRSCSHYMLYRHRSWRAPECRIAAAPLIRKVSPYQLYARRCEQSRDDYGVAFLIVALTVGLLQMALRKEDPPPMQPRHPEMRAAPEKDTRLKR